MEFTGEIDACTKTKVEEADSLLADPARIAELNSTGLMDSPSEESFDRLAHLAAKILKVPLTIVSLVGAKKQFFKASYGLPDPVKVAREIPIDGSICRYTLKGEPIIVADASVDPLLMHHPATKPWGIVAFIAIPMIMPSGHVLGAFCAVDNVKREWSDEDILLLRELTASVMTEINLRVQIRKYELERDLRDRFVTALTHDLRSPLSAVKLTAQILERKITDPAHQKSLARISETVDRADHMIRDLLDMSQIKAGEQVPIHPEKCNLNTLVKLSLDAISPIYGNRFEIKSSQDKIQGLWDPSALRRVIDNLLGNAIKYGKPEGVITVLLKQLNNQVEISIHNIGNPIPVEDQEELFEAFHRSEAATRGKQRGWGIGLTLVRGFVEAHHGTIKVSSSALEGTTFTVILPQEVRIN